GPAVRRAVRTRANKYTAETYIDRIHREHPDLDEQIRRLEAQKANGISQLNPYEHIPQTEKLSTAELKRLESLYEIRANLQVATNITSGDQAILFDPDNDRIIMANGDLTTPPDHAIIFAPGTGTDMTSFANSLTGISDAIVTELSERGRSGVVFTAMDGPWSTWLGEGFNGSEAEMAERAEKIQDLANNIRLEDYGANTEHVGIGYSAGESKFAISESKGHVTDESISIGGSYVGYSWIPDPNAEYTPSSTPTTQLITSTHSAFEHQTPSKPLRRYTSLLLAVTADKTTH
uniref:hypothetical protein n=1 Tax=Gulosibacter bifidus TaxID=272239 RepID=UPI001C9D854C